MQVSISYFYLTKVAVPVLSVAGEVLGALWGVLVAEVWGMHIPAQPHGSFCPVFLNFTVLTGKTGIEGLRM